MLRASSPLVSVEDARAPTVRLRVARARPYDVGTGTARLGPAAFRRLGIAVGDVIELVGRRGTTAVALRLQFEDRGLDLVRIDGVVRAPKETRNVNGRTVYMWTTPILPEPAQSSSR